MALQVTKVRTDGNGVDTPWLFRVAETFSDPEALRLSQECKKKGIPRLYGLRSIEEWAGDALPLVPSQCLSLVQLAALRWLENEEEIFLVTDDVSVGSPQWDEENRAWLVAVLVG